MSDVVIIEKCEHCGLRHLQDADHEQHEERLIVKDFQLNGVGFQAGQVVTLLTNLDPVHWGCTAPVEKKEEKKEEAE